MVSKSGISGAQILIVDDNAADIRLLESMLENNGFKSVLSTTNPSEAADLYRKSHPDLVLLAVDMPGLDGLRVMELLRKAERRSYLPVIAITPPRNEEVRAKALERGAKDFISRPFDKTETLTRIRNILELRFLHQKLQGYGSKLERRVRARTNELHETRLEIIRRLGLAAEYKDNETGLHIIRISKMCQTLAKAAGMSDREVETLLNASPMHDIGKIGIPDRILLKPGRLDPHEREIMKTHTTIGARMLGDHPSLLLRIAKEVAHCHHERWDGTGYPDGLRGEDIPLSGRICAIADVFDALTSNRPYKKAWSLEDAVAEINRGKASQFDPGLVDLFNDALDEFIAIKEEYQEPGKL